MRSVSILTGLDTHLDHLGVLSAILRIPLIVTEDRLFQLAKKYYPQLNAKLMDPSELTLEYMAHHFDCIFQTGKFWAADLSASLELLFGKKMRFVFCPHGNSDKGHSIQELASQDLSLVYGDHLLDLLKRNGSFDRIKKVVKTGNYRLSYYLEHKAFYDKTAQENIFTHFAAAKPTILYAPTWDAGCFFAAAEHLIAELEDDYNLIIKLHPLSLEHHPAHVYALCGRYEGHPSVLILNEFPPIYPLLDKCACYIGDYSSIGYDFLAFDRPLFFLPSKPSSYESPLYRCGKTLSLEDLPQLTTDDYSLQRQKTYQYAFGAHRTLEEIYNDIFSSI